MDQGPQETRITPELVRERYQTLRDILLKNETTYEDLITQLQVAGKRGETVPAQAEATLRSLRIVFNDVRHILEWVKLAFDEEETRLETALKALNNFVKRYGPMLEKIEAERTEIERRVHNIGPR
jgi:hypothetical protein